MTPAAIAYDLFMLLGAGLVTAGVALMFGGPPALITAGALVMALTHAGARVGMRQQQQGHDR